MLKRVEEAEERMSDEGATTAEADLLTTGDMARLTRSTLRTVRFYEQEGLIQAEDRSSGGHRLFTSLALERLQLALDLREAGLSIQGIRELFSLKEQSRSAKEATASITRILETQVAEMQRKIGKLRGLHEELVSMVGVMDECRLCDGKRFPACGGCEVTSGPGLPRALRVIWGG